MRKLLIADDEEGVRSLVRMTLESDRYQIIEASDGEEALEMARLHKPDLILLDVEMPRRSGLEVCRELKGERGSADTTIVMLTARAQETDIDRGKAAGADEYFTKPFSPFALMAKVDEILTPGADG